ncbi:hypothetical protein KHC17_10090 [Agrobacterium salinitolerans]|uniref:hypothetical protein n=1 Tax=Agrobacterium salinitolerans TaxID=1183413 RepID=UPI001C24AAC1|nr:hypothetical protein [Agrobacterium salinitolerans]QXC50885.1 hypothetical protein KHC17_10090 [Agrobacterium salinitolerans]
MPTDAAPKGIIFERVSRFLSILARTSATRVAARVWDAAERKAEYYEAFRNAALRVESGQNKGQHFKYGEVVPTWGKLTELHRAAFAEQLVTPAAHKLAIDWKKSQSKLLGYVRGLVTPEQLAASIADDEDFLACHPIRRTRAE